MKPYKFTIVAHFLDFDAEDKIIGEGHSDAVELYGESLTEIAESYDKLIENSLKEVSNAS